MLASPRAFGELEAKIWVEPPFWRIENWGRGVKKILLAALVAAVSPILVSQEAAAGSGCRASDNPMVWHEGFGVSRCTQLNARGTVRRASSDPMVWSDNRWRSTLFGGYRRDYDTRYDRRFRRAEVSPTRIVRVETVIVVDRQAEPAAAEATKNPGPKRAYLKRNAETDRWQKGSQAMGHRCSGILVLTWKAGVPRSQCFDNDNRIRRAPG